jgi:ribonuclease HII
MNLAELEIETSCFYDGAYLVAGVDEVGRGPIAGPVVVGAVLLNSAQTDEFAIPHGLTDSKLLSEKKRVLLVPEIKKWAFSYGIGQCSPEVVDEKGIMYALSKAGNNALESAMSKARSELCNTDSTKQGLERTPFIDVVLLDGTFDYLSTSTQPGELGCPGERTGDHAPDCASGHASGHAEGHAPDCADACDGGPAAVGGCAPDCADACDGGPATAGGCVPAGECARAYSKVKTIKKGDMKCASIAAASVLAKVYRDGLMVKLSSEFPEYEWAKNKGYGTKAHFEAVKQFGSTRHHRKSWLK